MKTSATFGSVSHGTMRAQDLIPAFRDALAELVESYGLRCDAQLVKDADEWISQNADNDDTYTGPDHFCNGDELVCELAEALEAYAPAYGYFGSHPGDGADYGFWLCEEWLQMAKDDGALVVSDLSEVAHNYAGEVIVISDHGNATLYVRQLGDVDEPATLREVWSVV